MMKTNYHTHHYLCRHASGNVEDYVLEAIDKRYSEIGISDHGPILGEAFPRMSLDEYNNIYLKELSDVTKRYSDKIKIYRGLEIEYIKEDLNHYKALLDDLDYLILAMHYYEDKHVLHDYSSYAVYDHARLARYTEVAIEAMNTGLFKIFAHPDIFMNGYKHLDDFGVECVKKICDAAIKNDVLLEVNAAGIRCGRTYEGKPFYPNDEFFKVVATTKAKVIINSDCHQVEELDDIYMQKAKEFAFNLKLNVVEKIFD